MAMNVLAACKIVPDDQDIKPASDGTLDCSRAHMVVSQYDKNALEGAAALKGDGVVKVISVGPASCDDSKVKKDILARGVDELLLVADDACAGLDARATAGELAKLVEAAGAYDVVIVGDGSADLYAKQTGVQLAARLNLPYVAGIIAVEEVDGGVRVRRALENEVEVLDVPTPAVLSIAPEFAEPRILGMKEILAGGKKPSRAMEAESAVANATLEVSCKAPRQVERACELYSDITEFVAAVKAAL